MGEVKWVRWGGKRGKNCMALLWLLWQYWGGRREGEREVSEYIEHEYGVNFLKMGGKTKKRGQERD